MLQMITVFHQAEATVVYSMILRQVHLFQDVMKMFFDQFAPNFQGRRDKCPGEILRQEDKPLNALERGEVTLQGIHLVPDQLQDGRLIDQVAVIEKIKFFILCKFGELIEVRDEQGDQIRFSRICGAIFSPLAVTMRSFFRSVIDRKPSLSSLPMSPVWNQSWSKAASVS